MRGGISRTVKHRMGRWDQSSTVMPHPRWVNLHPPKKHLVKVKAISILRRQSGGIFWLGLFVFKATPSHGCSRSISPGPQAPNLPQHHTTTCTSKTQELITANQFIAFYWKLPTQ